EADAVVAGAARAGVAGAGAGDRDAAGTDVAELAAVGDTDVVRLRRVATDPGQRHGAAAPRHRRRGVDARVVRAGAGVAGAAPDRDRAAAECLRRVEGEQAHADVADAGRALAARAGDGDRAGRSGLD